MRALIAPEAMPIRRRRACLLIRKLRLSRYRRQATVKGGNMHTDKSVSEETARNDSIVFQPGRIGSIQIKNRLVRSATFENAANGEVSDTLIQIHRKLARGGTGLIITGIAWVDPAMTAPRITRADNDSFIPGLSKLTGAVHDADPDCRIMLQLHHPGRQVIGHTDRQPLLPLFPPALLAYMERHPDILQQGHEESDPVAPSAVYDSLFGRTPRALSAGEVDQLIDAYAEGIRRAQESGFDGAELHAAHGWLLSSFLSPHTNRREDLYGGNIENRTRILREIYIRARKKVGPSFPILVKFNAIDLLPGGIEIEEGIAIGRILSETGFDALEVSGGMWEVLTRGRQELGFAPVFLPESRTEITKSESEAYFLPAARVIKKSTNATVISVGGYRSFSIIQQALESGSADFISLSRPLIREPDLPNRWLSGKGADRAACVSCNACLPLGEEALRCRALRNVSRE